MMILETDRLSIAFGGVRAIDEVNIAVEAGQVFSIIGPNGSGKTTLFNLVSGIYTPNDGSIKLAGKSATGLAPTSLHGEDYREHFKTFRSFTGCPSLKM